MSQVLPKDEAEKIVFKFQPKAIKHDKAAVATDFIHQQTDKKSDFKIDPIVAEQSGVANLQRQTLEAQVEATVLERVKEVQEQAYAKAYELGLHEGSEKAFADRKEELAKRIQEIDGLLAELDDVKNKILKENEALIIKMIFGVSKKIALREISLNQEPIVSLIQQLIDGLQNDDQVVLNLAQEDLQFIEELRKRENLDINFNHVKLVGSDAIQAGGCILETNYGTIDASVPQRVEKVWDTLKQKLPNLRGHNTDGGNSDGSEPQS